LTFNILSSLPSNVSSKRLSLPSMTF
jgi:hypothetical protein